MENIFEGRKLVNEFIEKLMNEGYSEVEARTIIAKWTEDTPIKQENE